MGLVLVLSVGRAVRRIPHEYGKQGWNVPLALAHKALRVSSHGMTFTNATSSTTVLLNALAVEIASRHRDDTVDALSRINRILSEGSLLVDDEN